MPDFILPLLSLTDGLIFLLTAVFAHSLGLDPDAVWGRTRFSLLTIGLLLVCVSLWMIVSLNRKVQPVASFLKSGETKAIVMVCHLWALIFLTYAWFITYGTFTKWDHTSNYYAQLADAFNQGRTYLDVKPSEAILARPDPYDPSGRSTDQETIWDMSLYEGRIYLYWGPVPALLIAPIQRFFQIKILDIFINLFAYAGLVIVNSIILLKVRKSFFPEISVWNLFVCIILIGLISPVLWALIPSTIYGTAIGAGHFFLMGGIYFALCAFDGKPSMHRMWLFLAGLFWACSVGSRALNAPSIVFLAGLTAIWIAKTTTPRPFHWTSYVQTTIPLFIPLIVGAIATGWYNVARFDSPLEFGLRYQITFFNLRRDLGLTFQPDYLPLNLYVYLLQPFSVTTRFPFALPLYTPDVLSQHQIAPPKMFFAGRMTGLLFGAPFLLLALVHLFPEKHAAGEGRRGQDPIHDFLMYGLAGSFLIGLLGLMFFFFGQMRYLVDIISQITILAILGYWRLISVRQATNSAKSKLLVTASHLLLAFTICISLLLAVTSETSRMQKNNPQLLEKIADTLSFEK